MFVLKSKAQEIMERLPGPPRRAVEQRHIQRALGGELAGREALHMVHRRSDLVERKLTGVQQGEKIQPAFHIFLITAGRRTFAIAGDPVVIRQFHDGHGKMMHAPHVAAAGDFPKMRELQVAPPKLDPHGETKAQTRRVINQDCEAYFAARRRMKMKMAITSASASTTTATAIP